MKHSKSTPTGKLARAVLFAALLALIFLFLGLASIGIFGTEEQFTRAKDMLPLVASLLTPLLTAAIAAYMPKS
jgi:hypothetical protein